MIVIGTVKGDLHDIGKNLVGMMAEGAGFTIVDLGTDTSAERFIAAAREHQARIVGMSALLTTTMIYMRTVVQKFEEAGIARRDALHRRRAGQRRLRASRSAPTATRPTPRAPWSSSSGSSPSRRRPPPCSSRRSRGD